MTRIIRMLVAVTAVFGLGALGLMSAGAASASNGSGTYGPGSWFFDQGDGHNAIQAAKTTTSTDISTAYQAQVQQPINPNGSSVWPTKKGVIPVQFYLQQATKTTTLTTTTDAVYPSTLESDLGTPYPGLGSYGALVYSPPTGATVSDVSNLTAYFTWLNGSSNHAGSMRWEINTPDGNVFVYYGDPLFQGTSGSGVNMMSATDARFEASQLGHTSPLYDTLANILAAPAPSGGTIASEPVNWINLTVDAGYGGTQQVQLSDVQETVKGVTSEYVPGTVSGSTSTTSSMSPWTNTTSPAMYIDIAKGNSNDPGAVDETTYTGVGDTSGQFAVVDGKYKYNLSNQLSAGTYNVFMTPDTDGNRIPVSNSPTRAATFVLK